MASDEDRRAVYELGLGRVDASTMFERAWRASGSRSLPNTEFALPVGDALQAHELVDRMREDIDMSTGRSASRPSSDDEPGSAV
jgi:hypothetical protein